jgi:hypothetical protein
MMSGRLAVEEETSAMRSGSLRVVLCVGFAAALALGVAEPASAKIFPIESIAISTAQLTAGYPIDVVVRFGGGTFLGDSDATIGHELVLFPVARTDAAGWPLDRDDPGVPVPIRRVGPGLFRGSFVVDNPGEYRLVSWSAFFLHESQPRVTRNYPAPLAVHVAAGADAATARSDSSEISSTTAGAIAAGTIVIIASAAAWLRGRRRRQLAILGVNDRRPLG